MFLETHLPAKLCPHPRLSSDYSLCKKNKVIYYRKAALPSHYEEDYFFKEYKEQYGRTYIEDETYLRHLARKRLAAIEACLSRQKVSQKKLQIDIQSSSAKAAKTALLEIGCAFGFFLDEASQAAFAVQGLELSQKAAAFAQENLKLKVYEASFMAYPLEAESWDVICAFYVLEHIPQQRSVFTKIARALKKGGLFCFALPSTYGPLFRSHPQKWMQSHPVDHFVDYSPQSLKKVFALYGLSLYKLWPATYHPERLGALWTKQPFASLYRFYARALRYGDTLEGIAIKK